MDFNNKSISVAQAMKYEKTQEIYEEYNLGAKFVLVLSIISRLPAGP